MSLNSVEEAVRALVSYGLKTSLIVPEESVYSANSIFDALNYEPSPDFSCEAGEDLPLEDILGYLLDYAVSKNLIDSGIASRDLFDTRLMGLITPRPGQVIDKFSRLYEKSPKEATDYFYALSRDSDYIRSYRIRKDRKWRTSTEYGQLDITINLSKPEKDPKAIAAAAKKKQDNYPRCLLCHENLGYHGRLDHPARQNIRLIPLKLDDSGRNWYLQYSPYVYYNEHCIVLSPAHEPMRITPDTFRRLLNFIHLFPHYTLGSNADLPIVGGSILSHDHYQGGNYEFAMARAPIRESVSFRGYEDIRAGIVKWPMSVIRLLGSDRERLAELASKILEKWRRHSEPSCDILAFSGDTPHNTITPISRRRGEDYELDLVLRNNRTTDEHPLGIFHPHAELHHIKKENIGLIEVMGLAVLPSRLLGEMEMLKETILSGGEIDMVPDLCSHADWAYSILSAHPEFSADAIEKNGPVSGAAERLDAIIRDEIGLVFMKVLKDCGVYKDDEKGRAGFLKFIDAVNA